MCKKLGEALDGVPIYREDFWWATLIKYKLVCVQVSSLWCFTQTSVLGAFCTHLASQYLESARISAFLLILLAAALFLLSWIIYAGLMIPSLEIVYSYWIVESHQILGRELFLRYLMYEILFIIYMFLIYSLLSGRGLCLYMLWHVEKITEV